MDVPKHDLAWPRLFASHRRVAIDDHAAADAGLPAGSEGRVRAKLGPHGPYVVEVDAADIAVVGGIADAATPELRLFFFGTDELTWLHDDPPV